MKQTIELPVGKLKTALSGLNKIISYRSSLPALGCVRLSQESSGAAVLAVTDLDSFASFRLADTQGGPFNPVLIPFESLSRQVKGMDSKSRLSINVSGDKASFAYDLGGTRMEQAVKTQLAEDWPNPPVIESNEITLDPNFKPALREAFECSSEDSSRFVLQGAYVDVSKPDAHYLVGTNGMCLYTANSFAMDLPGSVILPKRKFLQWPGRIDRVVRKDGTVRIENELYELNLALRGLKVQLELDPWVMHPILVRYKGQDFFCPLSETQWVSIPSQQRAVTLLNSDGGLAGCHALERRQRDGQIHPGRPHVRRGLKTKAEMGWFPGATPPGYVNRTHPDGRKTIATDPKRIPIVRKCWDLMLTGKYTPADVWEIANNVLGFRTVNGKPMTRSTIYNIFSSKFYSGIYEYPKASGIWHTGRHTPMVTEEEFEQVQRHLARGRKWPKNRKVFAFTGLIRCGSCDRAVTAEEKHQIICSFCRFKFSNRGRTQCPRCMTGIKELKSPTKLHYTYYHCTESGKGRCGERSLELRGLLDQISKQLERVGLPEAHQIWIEGRLAHGDGAKPDIMASIRESFGRGTLEEQRVILTAIGENLRLKNRILSIDLKLPFRRNPTLPQQFCQLHSTRPS